MAQEYATQLTEAAMRNVDSKEAMLAAGKLFAATHTDRLFAELGAARDNTVEAMEKYEDFIRELKKSDLFVKCLQ